MSTTPDDIQPTPLEYLNTADIERYLSFLAGSAGEKEIFTFALMGAESTTVIPGYGCFHAKSDEIISRMMGHHSATLHVCLNRTNLRGRKNTDIESCRVLVADIDKFISLDALKKIRDEYHPGMIVESSHGRYHLYWRVKSEIGLDRWKELQLGISHILGSDPNLAQVSHTIRVPGVMRIKEGAQIMPRIVFLEPEATENTSIGIGYVFLDVEEHAKQALETQKKERKQIAREIKASRTGTLKTNPNPKQGRNSYMYQWLFSWVSEAEVCPSFEQTLEKGFEVNLSLASPLEGEELRIIVKKVYPKASGSWELREEKKEKLRNVLIESELSQKNGVVNGCNGAVKTLDFAYDFDGDTLLKSLPYGESGLLRRVIQRFGSHLVSNEENVFGFDSEKLLWKKQDKLKPLLYDFVSLSAQDMVHEPGFINFFCGNKNGGRTLESLQKAQNKFAGHSVIRNTVHALCNSKDIKSVTPYDFDADGHLFFAANGVLDMRTLELREARAEDLLLKKSSVVWKTLEEPCPKWLEFLGQLFEDNDESEALIDFLQEVFGYSICGSIDSQKLFVHHGSGSNGKSKVLDALSLLGGSYATRMGYDALSKKKGDGKETERIGAEIEGRRIVIIDDLESQIKWNEGLLKMLTSPVMIARDLYKEKRDVPNRTKFHLGCNSIPTPETENFALLRRLCLIPYTRQFKPDADKEAQIREMLVREGSGLLAWSVRGYKRIMERGGQIIEPECVQLQIREYQEDNFKLENLIKELYGPPTGEDPGVPIPLLDLIDEVSKSMNPAEQVSYKDDLNLRKMGAVISRIFEVEPERKRVNGLRERVYRLIRLKNPLL